MYDFLGYSYMKKVTENGTTTRHERYLYRGYLQIDALDILHGDALFWDPTEPLARHARWSCWPATTTDTPTLTT